MPEWIDVGPCQALYEQLGERTLVLLPPARGAGAQWALWAAAIAAQELGWSTLAVWDEYHSGYEDEAVRLRWVRERAEAGLARAGDNAVLAGKSLASFAAELGRAAIWYTPLLTEPVVAEALRRTSAPVLLVGGTADPSWDSAIAESLPAEVLELEDVDHAMQVAADLDRSLAVLRETAERTRTFLRALH
jgi:pimeloyl-ACP methyl ester carboxylesterase